MEVIQQLEAVQNKIDAACKRVNRNPAEIKIVAVTKYVSNERTAEAVGAGILHIGENRVEGLKAKQAFLSKCEKDITWHFIGSLQSRKVKDVLCANVDYIHSLDRLSLAEEIQKRSTSTVHCFVQVNVSEEQSKHGLKVEEVIPFIQALESFPHIHVVGLMTMAPLDASEQEIRKVFRHLKNLQMRIEEMNLPYAPCHECSMGMSNDFEIAIEEGATFIRLGTILVGSF